MNSYAPRHGRRSARAAAVALAASSTLLLAACSGGANSSGAQNGTPREGGDLKIAIDSDPICIDPSQTNLIASAVIGRQVVDSLVEQNPDTGEFEPWLATEWSANADGTSYDFTLKDGVTFSDGTPLDSTAVKNFFDQLVASPGKTATAAGYLAGYTGTTVVDPTHFTVGFSAPNAPFLMGASSASLGILGETTLKTSFEDRCRGIGIVGSGPFVLSDYTVGESAKITAREGYDWAPAGAAHSGRAHLDSVTYLVSTEPSVRSGGLKSGQVDVATTIQSQDEQTLSGGGFSILSRTNPGVLIGAAPDLSHSVILRDPQVRKALQLAIDQQDIADTVLTPTYGTARSLLGDTTPGFTDLSSELTSDKEQAKKLLDEAGWKVGSDGIREKDGQKLSLSILYFYQVNVYEYLQQQLRAVGIDLQLNQVTSSEFTPAFNTHAYDLRSVSFSRPDPDILRTVFGQANLNSAGLDPADPATVDFEGLLAAQRETTDQARRNDIASDIQSTLIENDWAYPLSQLVQVIGVSDDVTGLRFDSFSRFLVYDAGFSE
ncbi:ABC transporter substrate-binding protein [Rhodococcus sp. Eu-32]|uniref:ABC transporter substrate-binding protein n=1 Tax=Rhodococcus sp. Eu-32 TaxID=1017319 RepID=UPI000DF35C01|nr:ABC transporter substrate-binding protein [Rhodococcus sp. Eu-32]RRQ26579.1 ABC transporter substrate-binding protein [Rhodococcus sp. Eu-32]